MSLGFVGCMFEIEVRFDLPQEVWDQPDRPKNDNPYQTLGDVYERVWGSIDARRNAIGYAGKRWEKSEVWNEITRIVVEEAGEPDLILYKHTKLSDLNVG